VTKGGDPIRLGIVDDHPVFRLGLARALEREGDMQVAWDIGSTKELLNKMRSSPVEVVLMDLSLGPGEDSLVATNALIQRHAGVKVVVISALIEPEAAQAAKAAGAIAYMPKDLAVSEIVAALRETVARSGKDLKFAEYLPAAVTSRSGRTVSRHGLTPREQEVVKELRRGRTNREIASKLGVSTPTVNKHVQHVLKKLGVRSRGQAVARLHAEAAGRLFT
jgi:two-component system NarL family response regulator